MDIMAQDIFSLDLGLPADPAPSFTPKIQNLPAFTDFDCPEEITNYPTLREPLTPWPSRLPTEIALGADSLENILMRHDATEEDYINWAMMPAFRRALAEAAKDVRENGLTFKGLCRGIAEDFLPELDQKLHDKLVPFAQKLDALKSIVRWAGLEPKEDKNLAAQSQNLVNIQINL